jgi:hypothetical protein
MNYWVELGKVKVAARTFIVIDEAGSQRRAEKIESS